VYEGKEGKEEGRRYERRTKYLPAFTEPFSVFGIDHIYNRMTVVEIPMPNIPDTTLAAEIPELEDGRGQSNLPS
jgi:hypothetical protein